MDVAKKIAKELVKSIHDVATNGECQVDAGKVTYDIEAGKGAGSLVARVNTDNLPGGFPIDPQLLKQIRLKIKIITKADEEEADLNARKARFVDNLFTHCFRDDQGRLRHGEDADIPAADLVEFVCDGLSGLYDVGSLEAKECTTCTMCGEKCDKKTAHMHQGKMIGDECCWDEQLRSSE